MLLPTKDKWNSVKDEVQYDPGYVAYLGFIFDPLRPCVDVGANVGKVTRFLAHRTREKVTAFEPAPSTFKCLQANTKALANVVIVNKALGHTTGTFKFVGDGTVTGHLSDGRRGEAVAVDVTTLDAYLSPQEDVGLLKIDVEGNELSVLEGAKKTILRTMPLLAIEVIDDHLKRAGTTRADIFRAVIALGYKKAVNKYGMRESAMAPTGAADIFFFPSADWYSPNLSIGYNRLKEGDVEA